MKRITSISFARAATLVLALLTTATAWAETVKYIDTDGIEKTANATVIDNDILMEGLADGGWYVVSNDIDYSNHIGINAGDCSDIVNPVFTGVTVSSTAAASETEGSEWVDFVGTYKPAAIYESGTEKHNLYLGTANTLYYPTTSGFQVNACRAYFVLKNDLTAGEPADPQQANVRAFTLNFGDEDTAIKSLSADAKDFSDGAAWYTLDGRRLSGKPTKSGIYVNGGRKVVIK